MNNKLPIISAILSSFICGAAFSMQEENNTVLTDLPSELVEMISNNLIDDTRSYLSLKSSCKLAYHAVKGEGMVMVASDSSNEEASLRHRVYANFPKCYGWSVCGVGSGSDRFFEDADLIGQQMLRLEYLDLVYQDRLSTRKFFDKFASLMQELPIKYLNLAHTYWAPSMNEEFAHLIASKHLKSLNLNGTKIDVQENSLEFLATLTATLQEKANPWEALSYLDLGGIGLFGSSLTNTHSAQLMTGLLGHTLSLKELNLEHTSISDSTLPLLEASLSGLDKLEVLNLWNQDLTPGSIPLLKRLCQNLGNLKTLILYPGARNENQEVIRQALSDIPNLELSFEQSKRGTNSEYFSEMFPHRLYISPDEAGRN